MSLLGHKFELTNSERGQRIRRYGTLEAWGEYHTRSLERKRQRKAERDAGAT